MSSHAKLSPSGADRWVACPGSVAAEAGLPDSSSKYAVEGTAAHALAELCAAEDCHPNDKVGVTLELGRDGTWEVDEGMAHYVAQYLEDLDTFADAAQVRETEVRVPVGFITGESGAMGTADHAAILFNEYGTVTVQVHDLKYGQGVEVSAFENLQELMYGLGVIRHYDWALEGAKVRLHLFIHQPRLKRISDWEVEADELDYWLTFLKEKSAATYALDAPRIPGEKQCRFCKAKLRPDRCPEFQADIIATTADAPPAEVEGLVEVLPKLKMFRDWCAAVEARAIELLEQNVPVGDWKMVEGRGSRNWTVDDTEVVKKLQNRGMKKADIVTEKVISVAQAEKKLPKDKWMRLEKELVVRKEGKPTLAPGSDKRPAVNSADAMGFSDLT